MFRDLTVQVRGRTEVLNRFLSLCEACDQATANQSGALHDELTARSILITNITDERIFRHCTTIRQLYGIYEDFSESVIQFWLNRLPRYKSFQSLPPNILNSYRNGIARIIRDSDKRRFRHLQLVDVLDIYLSSLKDCPNWTFVVEALTSHDTNLRRPEFESMFHSVGLEGVWSYLEKSPSVIELNSNSDANKTLEQMILDLVTYRNDASHGFPDDILGVDSLREWIEFINVFCEELATFVTHQIVKQEAENIPESVYGIVTETFSDNISVITCNRCHIQVGDSLFFLRPSDCILARIESLQINNDCRNSVEIETDGVEVGIKTSERVRCGAQVIKVL